MKTTLIEYLNGLKHEVCTSCKTLSIDDITEQQAALPVWWDENNDVHYELPEVLRDLREEKKLLIQKINIYVPVKHLFKG